MTFSDYLFDSILVLMVVRQVRESRWSRHAMLLPLGIITAVAFEYLRSIPTGAADLVLVAALAALGVTFGAVSALATRVRTDGGRYALVKAGWISAGLWVLSMGSRFAFLVWVSHGGAEPLYRFTVAHGLSIDVWAPAIVLMALGEVVARVGVLSYRARTALQHRAPAGTAPAPLVTV